MSLNITSRHSFLNHLLKTFPNVDIYNFLYTWGRVAFNELRWDILVNSLGSDEPPQPTDHSLDWNPFSPNLASSPPTQPTPPPLPRLSPISPRNVCPFHTLGILPTFILKEIKTAYKKLSSFFHPDK